MPPNETYTALRGRVRGARTGPALAAVQTDAAQAYLVGAITLDQYRALVRDLERRRPEVERVNGRGV